MARSKLRPRRGVVAIEAALVFPIILLITLGLLEYGWAFLRAQQVTNTARQGARIAATADATTSEVLASIDAALAVAGLDANICQVTITPSDISTMQSGEILTVRIEVPYEYITLTGAPLVPVPGYLRAEVSMAREGA